MKVQIQGDDGSWSDFGQMTGRLVGISGVITEVRPMDDSRYVWVTANGGVGTFSVSALRGPQVGETITVFTDGRDPGLKGVELHGQRWDPRREE